MTKSLHLILTTLFFIFICIAAFAQPAKRQIKGTLVDETNKPVDYATVSVVNAVDSLLEKSSVSDKNGVFQVSELKNGSYRLIISQLGLKNYIRSFIISSDKPSIDFGTLLMTKDVRNLNEVAVKAPKELLLLLKKIPLNLMRDRLKRRLMITLNNY
ncbi:carboxypeptidase regulatory-like domain-containing protein [Mucilaginibacter xinganensis]|uniref:Carboxypeptidase regulatory-like domain-containing protein n=1 Tax=Mucilaginibacter xinganensis TaxID=1234841 RepID=A0A223P2U8_9SPHI|nr:carboxypeptidase regulatory-like domain-containing protein [Mucilaginibacter xinganensis]ASU36469.1 hypothetical protein MuYL_4584 [Mucilaginibacter xinganensis]